MKLKDAEWVAPLLMEVAKGKTLQFRTGAECEWQDGVGNISFAIGKENYRIKPTPQWRLARPRNIGYLPKDKTIFTKDAGLFTDVVPGRDYEAHWEWLTDWADMPKEINVHLG